MEEQETMEISGTTWVKHSQVHAMDSADGTLEITSYWREMIPAKVAPEPKGLILDGVEHRKVKEGETLKKCDRYKSRSGGWLHTIHPGLTPAELDPDYYRPIKTAPETYEILGKTCIKLGFRASDEEGDFYVTTKEETGDYYREVKTEAKAPPESFLKKIAMECGTVDGYAPSDFMHWLESVKS